MAFFDPSKPITGRAGAVYADLLIECKEDVANDNDVYVGSFAFDEITPAPTITPTRTPIPTITPTITPTPHSQWIESGGRMELWIDGEKRMIF